MRVLIAHASIISSYTWVRRYPPRLHRIEGLFNAWLMKTAVLGYADDEHRRAPLSAPCTVLVNHHYKFIFLKNTKTAGRLQLVTLVQEGGEYLGCGGESTVFSCYIGPTSAAIAHLRFLTTLIDGLGLSYFETSTVKGGSGM